MCFPSVCADRIGASARERGLQPMKPKYAEVRAKVRRRHTSNPFFKLHALRNHDVELPDAFSCQMRSAANTLAGISAGIASHSDQMRANCGRMWGFCKRTQRSSTKSPFDDLAMQRTPHWVSLVKLIANRPSIVRTSKVPNKVR